MQIAGHRIHVETLGAGAPAVMIHCALARHEALLPLATALNQHHVTLFDMPGHGRSDDWDGKTEYQGLVADVTTALCDGPTHLIGHSFGGTVALRVAVMRPDLVSRLTLIEPVYFAAAKGTNGHAAFAKAFRPFVGAMLAGDEARAAEIFNNLWGGAPWDKTPERLRKYMTDRIHLIVAGGGAIEEDADGITSENSLRALDIPVILIRGDQSPDVIADIHTVLASRISGARDHAIPGASHMVPVTHMKDVAKIIRAADQETG